MAWRAAVALALAALAGPVAAEVLRVEGPQGVLLEAPAPQGARWCLAWSHSVTGGAVADCFVNDGGRMILARSYLHDFAAGLGTVEGRGTLVSAPQGGYWIEGIDEPVAGDALVLRVGAPAVDHRLRIGGTEHSLTALAAGQRVTLRLLQDIRGQNGPTARP